ncbi:hypothetical protein AB4Y89_00090 [Terriglobus sp. 2YAB30_2]
MLANVLNALKGSPKAIWMGEFQDSKAMYTIFASTNGNIRR